jgi:hypothetical protein
MRQVVPWVSIFCGEPSCGRDDFDRLERAVRMLTLCDTGSRINSAKAIVGLRRRFRPTYTKANVGHPSDSLRPCYETHSVGTLFGNRLRRTAAPGPRPAASVRAKQLRFLQ